MNTNKIIHEHSLTLSQVMRVDIYRLQVHSKWPERKDLTRVY